MSQDLLIKINGDAKNFRDELSLAQKKTKDLEKSLSAVAKISSAAFLGLAAAVGAAAYQFSKFEKEFTNVVTLLDKGSFKTKSLEEGITSLKDGILSLGAKSGESFDTLNKGLFDIISATGDAENAMAVLESATQLAIAGGTDVSVAVDGITTAIKAFGLETSDAQEISEKFFQAQKGGKTTVEELSTSLGLVASTANAFGVSLDEVLAASSAATLAGIKTNATFTGMKAVFANISKPTKDAAAEAKRLGIQFDSTALRSLGLKGFLEQLTTAQGFNKTSIEKLFASTEAQGVAFALTGEQAKDFAKQIELIGDTSAAAATFQDALAVKNATLDKSMARLKQSANAVAITYGEAFAPSISAAADALSEIAKGLSEMDDSTKDTLVTLTKWGLAITGTIAVVTGLALAYLKVRNTLIAFNIATGIGSKIQKAYNFTLAFGTKALRVFRLGMVAATTTVRGFAAATGIGLILIALSLMITHMKETKAVASGAFAAISTVIRNFASGVSSYLGGIGDLLIGVFTLDKDRILKGLDGIGAGIKKVYTGLGKGAGDAYSQAYRDSIATSEAADLPEPQLEDPEASKKKEDKKKEKPEEDQSNLDDLVAKEEVAAAKIREIRGAENDLLREQNARAARDRIEIKDATLKKLFDQETKAIDDDLKLKTQHLGLIKEIDKLQAETSELTKKAELGAKEKAQIEANEQELAILQEQLGIVGETITENAAEQVLKQEERDLARLERIIELGEEEAIIREELQLLSEEQRDLLDEQDLEKAALHIKTKRDLEKLDAKEDLKDNILRRNKYLKDEIKHGAAFAKVNEFIASKSVALADETAGKLVKLTQSKNKQLKGIGKAAAITQIGIKTAEGAISAYSSLSGIPIVGPALGVIAAGALVLYGAEQAGAVASAQRGGLVPNGIGGAADRIPALLEPGEIVVPQALAPDFIQQFGRPDADGGAQQSGPQEVIIGFTDEAVPYLEQKFNERRAIGTGGF